MLDDKFNQTGQPTGPGSGDSASKSGRSPGSTGAQLTTGAGGAKSVAGGSTGTGIPSDSGYLDVSKLDGMVAGGSSTSWGTTEVQDGGSGSPSETGSASSVQSSEGSGSVKPVEANTRGALPGVLDAVDNKSAGSVTEDSTSLTQKTDKTQGVASQTVNIKDLLEDSSAGLLEDQAGGGTSGGDSIGDSKQEMFSSASDDSNRLDWGESVRLFIVWLFLFLIGVILGGGGMYLIFYFGLADTIAPILPVLENGQKPEGCNYCTNNEQIRSSLSTNARTVVLGTEGGQQGGGLPQEGQAPTPVPTDTPGEGQTPDNEVAAPILLRSQVICGSVIEVDYSIRNGAKNTVVLDKFNVVSTNDITLKSVYVDDAGVNVGTTDRFFEISDVGVEIKPGTELKFGYKFTPTETDAPLILKTQAIISGGQQEDVVDIGSICGFVAGKGQESGLTPTQSPSVSQVSTTPIETPPPTGSIGLVGIAWLVVIGVMFYSLVYTDLLTLLLQIFRLGPFKKR